MQYLCDLMHEVNFILVAILFWNGAIHIQHKDRLHNFMSWCVLFLDAREESLPFRAFTLDARELLWQLLATSIMATISKMAETIEDLLRANVPQGA